MHGSLWPSQRGAAGLVKSLDQDSLLSIGSWTVDWWVAELGEGVEKDGFGVLGALDGLWVDGVGSEDDGLVSADCAWLFSMISAAGVSDGAVLMTWSAPGCSTRAHATAVPSIVAALDLKNPMRLCWPFPFALGTVAVEPGLTRFRDLAPDVSERGLLPLAGDSELTVSETLEV